jgi:2-keto-4-pentenoate hydratase/2-oxohepta-3-ene-1,7-dioic acid hydratase in catechol pathway
VPIVTRLEKIICIGFNYRKHAEETATPIPEAPPLFSEYRNALKHHDCVITLPTGINNRFDFETELVIVFGRQPTTFLKTTRLCDRERFQRPQDADANVPVSRR